MKCDLRFCGLIDKLNIAIFPQANKVNTLNAIPPDANPPLRLLMSTQRIFGKPQPDWLVKAPGRDMWVAAVVDNGHEYTVEADDLNASVRFSHRSAKTRQTVLKRPLPGWSRYPAGVVATLGDSGLSIPGFHAVVLGDEPSGPRYDFGMGMVFAAFCHEISVTAYTSDSLFEMVEAVRREFVGG